MRIFITLIYFTLLSGTSRKNLLLIYETSIHPRLISLGTYVYAKFHPFSRYEGEWVQTIV